ncbi:exosome complex RNA-binding protein Csl4 [Methanobrevibacter sp. TMH8]|uniref:exosome complex RNA-binding protein Csl4 n=1 Tax=Methanobrevibacter sp. TMH8 TaxID=2848611 RepID=UPI001CCE8FE8|nr:exosome complex RNA-binding protein Csl4 [Methanobrevibacter sp. TMH8]MBZ9570043.1 exosome complex RNA-binding protein Csl4 [Methanobrevibacter sp. TMH8]
MKVKSGDFVMPGDILGVSEQFLPDKWTYDDEGNIKAAVLGTVDISSSNKKISIIPSSGNPTVLNVGDSVYGEITDVRGQRAMINVQKMKGTDRRLALPYMAAIHISQVKKGYLEKLTDAFRIGDVIEAKVSKILGDNLDLNTENKEGGVIKAMCTRCRAYMVTTDRKDELYCEVCDRKERRKVSINYDCKE